MIYTPKMVTVVKGKKKVKEREITLCHVCRMITRYMCDFCKRLTCTKHLAGAVYRGDSKGKWGPHDICKECFQKEVVR